MTRYLIQASIVCFALVQMVTCQDTGSTILGLSQNNFYFLLACVIGGIAFLSILGLCIYFCTGRKNDRPAKAKPPVSNVASLLPQVTSSMHTGQNMGMGMFAMQNANSSYLLNGNNMGNINSSYSAMHQPVSIMQTQAPVINLNLASATPSQLASLAPEVAPQATNVVIGTAKDSFGNGVAENGVPMTSYLQLGNRTFNMTKSSNSSSGGNESSVKKSSNKFNDSANSSDNKEDTIKISSGDGSDNSSALKSGIALPGFLKLEPGRDFLIVENNQIGQGGTSLIGRGMFCNPELAQKHAAQEIALKFYKVDSDAYGTFRFEVALLASLSKLDNIVKFYGYCDNPMIIAMKMYTCSLTSIVKGSNGKPIPFPSLLKIAMDISRGMSKLHENRIVHYDLKPSNVLVDVMEENNYHCVICDFGYANIIGDEELADSLVKGLEKPRAIGITTQYASPELFSKVFIGRKGTVESDKKIDVYAYAVTMYEVLSRLKAWEGCNNDMIKELVIQGHRPKIPDHLFHMAAQPGGQALALLLDITNLSWSPDPSDRPEFKDIYKRIVQFITSSNK